ncbi:hypothetical protein AB0F91_39915 [Amycolatopsis sp. NPDC023774]|uniref:hypothetical protein n=1 Tax=Amycolatopsis sp. NPDC023774 TaxID=3155015 RepID=UPI0033FB51FE
MTRHITLNEQCHDAAANGASAELLLQCLRISDSNPRLAAEADKASHEAWDVVANLQTALRAS